MDWHASEGSDVKNLRSPQRNTESFGTNFGTVEDCKPGGGKHFMLPMKVRVKSGLAGTDGMAHGVPCIVHIRSVSVDPGMGAALRKSGYNWNFIYCLRNSEQS